MSLVVQVDLLYQTHIILTHYPKSDSRAVDTEKNILLVEISANVDIIVKRTPELIPSPTIETAKPRTKAVQQKNIVVSSLSRAN
jgi:hypothetical protein